MHTIEMAAAMHRTLPCYERVVAMTRSLRDFISVRAVDDALGVLYKFRPRGTFRCTDMVGHGCHNKPTGTWSDDTSMAHAICDSYRELGRVDVDAIRGASCVTPSIPYSSA